MEKILKILFGLLMVCMLNTYVFAESSNSSCKTCTSAPTAFTEYISNMQSLSSSLSAAGTGTIESKVVSSIKVYTDLLVAMPREFFGQDLLADFKILFNGYPAVRDRKRLLTLDRTLSDNARKLASNGTFDNKISDSDISTLNTKLSQLKVMKNFEIQKGVSYGDLSAVLWQVQKIYKEIFLAATYTNAKMNYDLDTYMSKAFKGYEGKFTSKGDFPVIDGNYISDLQKQYECALGPNVDKKKSCSEGLDKFLDDMEKIMKTLKDSDKIFKKFSDSRKKLQDALKGIGGKGFDGEYMQRHIKIKKQIELGPLEELLDEKKTTGMWSIGKLVQKMGDLKDGLRGSKEKSAEDLAAESKSQEKNGSESKDKTTTESPYTKHLRESYYTNMKSAFKSALEVGRSMNDDIPQETPDPSPTISFPELSKKVYSARKQVKQAKESLSDSCKKQCKNVEADCGD